MCQNISRTNLYDIFILYISLFHRINIDCMFIIIYLESDFVTVAIPYSKGICYPQSKYRSIISNTLFYYDINNFQDLSISIHYVRDYFDNSRSQPNAIIA